MVEKRKEVGSNTIAEEEHFFESGEFAADDEGSKIGEIEMIWKRQKRIIMGRGKVC